MLALQLFKSLSADSQIESVREKVSWPIGAFALWHKGDTGWKSVFHECERVCTTFIPALPHSRKCSGFMIMIA